MEYQIRIPFVEALGIELLRFENGEAELAITPSDEQLNSFGVLHGGVIMTLLDVAMAHAARSPRDGAAPDARGAVTIEMKTSFMRPGLGRVVAHSRVLRQTASFAFCEASALDTEGALVAHATGTFKYLKQLPAGGRRLKCLNASD